MLTFLQTEKNNIDGYSNLKVFQKEISNSHCAQFLGEATRDMHISSRGIFKNYRHETRLITFLSSSKEKSLKTKNWKIRK